MMLVRSLSLVSLWVLAMPAAFTSSSLENNENISPISRSNLSTLSCSSHSAALKKKASSPTLSHLTDIDNKLKPISLFQKTIEKAFEEALVDPLMTTHTAFNELNYDESSWEEIAHELKIKKWRSQKSWKNAVGGHLFFPHIIFDYLKNNDRDYLLQRSDILWACGLSGSFHHPLGLFYLAHTLAYFNRLDLSEPQESIEFCLKLLHKACDDLKQEVNDPLVFNTLAWGYMSSWGIEDPFKEIQEFGNLPTPPHPQSALLALQFKTLFKGVFRHHLPTMDDYLAVAQTYQYPPAYVAATKLDQEKEKTILEQQLPTSYSPIYLKLAELYKTSNGEKYNVYLEEAMRQGNPRAYIMKGIDLVGDLTWTFDKARFQALNHSLKEQASVFFQKAADMKYSRGFIYLGRLKHELSFLELDADSKELLEEEALAAYIEGCRLGDPEAYTLLYKLSPDLYDEVCEKIGPDPEDDLWNFFENLLKTNPDLDFSQT